MLVHRYERRPLRQPYLIWLCADRWREQGMEVSVCDRAEEAAEADIVIIHINQTRFDEKILEPLAGHPRVLNRAVTDISKRVISRELLRPEDDWDGGVVVKTDANFGGIPDARHVPPDRWVRFALRALERRVRGSRPRWARVSELHPSDYAVLPSMEEVPAEVWENERLVVERFRPEREGDFYVRRTYAFLGDAESTLRSLSNDPIIKSNNTVDRGFVPVHPDIVDRRKELGFDYGKLDYVIHEGRAFLFDANTTPTVGSVHGELVSVHRELVNEIGALLAEGIRYFAPGAR